MRLRAILSPFSYVVVAGEPGGHFSAVSEIDPAGGHRLARSQR